MLLNRTYLLLSVSHCLMMLWAIRFGIKKDRPVLVVICATLLCMNVIMAPLSDVSLYFYDNNTQAMIKAQLLCFVSDLIILAIALADVAVRERTSGHGLRALPPPPDGFLVAGILWGALILSIMGVGSSFMRILLWGGIEETWARTWDKEPTVTPFRGVLMLTSYLTALYPYAVFYCHKRKLHFGRYHYAMGALAFVAALGVFAISGTTTGPLLSMIPIGLLMIRNENAISWKRLIICGLLAMAFIWTFRLLRHIGKESYGSSSVSVGGAVGDFQDSELSVGNSMVMLHTFAMVIERIDHGDMMLMGRSYALVPLYFIPGVFVPWKNDFYIEYRPDSYTLERLTSRPFMGFLPSGFYGEGYMNFGLPGLLGISVFMGSLIAFLDDRYRRKFLGLPGDFIVPVTIASLVNSCRMYLADSMGMLVAQVGMLFLLTWSLAIIFRLLAPPEDFGERRTFMIPSPERPRGMPMDRPIGPPLQ